MKHLTCAMASALISGLLATPGAMASSHMDAPLITLDPPANTTDVYAFVTQRENGEKYLVVALGVYPFEEPGIGPNKYNFDDNVRYELHLALGDDVETGRKTLSYRFEFDTRFKNVDTILQSYLGVIEDVDDENQNLTQTYEVTKVDHRRHRDKLLGRGIVPPNNQGIVTPFYNENDDGENPAKGGVASADQVDKYTAQAIATLKNGYRSFAGQRDDGFYADIQAVFDLLKLRPDAAFDSQGGFNLHLIALEIPMDELGGDQQIVGVYGSTSREQLSILGKKSEHRADRTHARWIQVARQGNPLFNEGFVAIADKDRYSRTAPTEDQRLFLRYAEQPELARLINLLVIPGSGLNPAEENDRFDIAAIYIPDLIKVDLSTAGVRLAGGGADHPTTPDDPGFSRLSIFGGDTLLSTVQEGFGGGVVPGGWPNGRRFGDDVLDIAITAAISDLRTLPPKIQGPVGDGVDHNDQVFNKVFPYESTPQNGRNHPHHGG